MTRFALNNAKSESSPINQRGSARRIRTALALAALTALALVAAGCGGGITGGGGGTFSTPTYPFSFNYPSGWKITRNAAFNYGSSAGVRSVSAALAEPYDQVTITQYKLKKVVPAGLNGNKNEVDRIVARLTKQAKGSAGDAKVVEYGGAPGYQYIVEYSAADGTALENTLTFLFKGQNEFQINCQSSAKNRAKLDSGCAKVTSTLKITE